MGDAEVLVAGAGPTGLVLALWLTRMGVRVRIIDRTAGPGTTSRALVVHARTLELYAQLGLAEPVAARGLPFAAANLWARGRPLARAALGEMGAGLSPYPFMLIFPQDEHERFLIEQLGTAGVAVERQTELLGFAETAAGVQARLRQPDGTEEVCAAAYLAGCDGARSTVRDAVAAGFPGSTYAHLFYVADVDAEGPVMNKELHVALDDADFVAVFPLRAPGAARLIGTVRPEAEARQAALTWADVSTHVLGRLGVAVRRVNWFSTYHVHHRVAGQFRRGRAFLLGDSAHIHSPVGGQGMNTGIGDAVNLAWKLAAVLRARASPALLDTYAPERRAFAERLVATTDRAFTLVTSPGPLARRVRLNVVPRLLPWLVGFRAVRRLMFRTVSQTLVNYRAGALSEGRAGRIRGGDRLPWVPEADNFAPLQALEWQAHVYGEAAPALAETCARRRLALHVMPWSLACRRAGLRRGAFYLVRPDGYVALADRAASPARLEAWLDRWGVRLS